MMDLKGFLQLTADLPTARLRAAMVKAIAADPPSRSYSRFYCRVLRELGRTCDKRRAT